MVRALSKLHQPGHDPNGRQKQVTRRPVVLRDVSVDGWSRLKSLYRSERIMPRTLFDRTHILFGMNIYLRRVQGNFCARYPREGNGLVEISLHDNASFPEVFGSVRIGPTIDSTRHWARGRKPPPGDRRKELQMAHPKGGPFAFAWSKLADAFATSDRT